MDTVREALGRVLGSSGIDLRPDTPLAGVGIEPDGWVCLAWALRESGSLVDSDVPGVTSVADIQRLVSSRA